MTSLGHLLVVGVCHLLVRDNINLSHSLVIEWANFGLLFHTDHIYFEKRSQ